MRAIQVKCQREVKARRSTRTSQMRVSPNQKSRECCEAQGKMERTIGARIIHRRNFPSAQRHRPRIKTKVSERQHLDKTFHNLTHFTISFQLMNQIVCLRHRHRPYQWRQHRPEIPHQQPHRIRQLLINSSRHKVKIPSSFTHASEKSKQVESHRRQTQPTFVIRTQKTAKRPKSFILTSSLSPTAIRCSSI